MRIRYLSYGLFKTGGYRHEKGLLDAAVSYLKKSGEVIPEIKRKNKLFQSLAGYLELSVWAYFKSTADINIVTARTAVSALFRNAKSKNQVWIVLHNFDPNDGKNKRMAAYYEYLFKLLKKLNNPRFKVIAVAPYWVDYFSNTLQLPHVYLFPNFFDLSRYAELKTNHKNAWVHLGQFTSKNDPAILNLAERLSTHGYYCFFSTLNPEESVEGKGKFDILYFLNYNAYLEHVSRACCTLALSRVNEGWNRMAHESILLGTPVIGYDKGGLGDLLKESSSIVVNDIEEAYTCIVNSLWVLPENKFNAKYDILQSETYMQALCQH